MAFGWNYDLDSGFRQNDGLLGRQQLALHADPCHAKTEASDRGLHHLWRRNETGAILIPR